MPWNNVDADGYGGRRRLLWLFSRPGWRYTPGVLTAEIGWVTMADGDLGCRYVDISGLAGIARTLLSKPRSRQLPGRPLSPCSTTPQ
jgi:hypothetical protein